MMQEVYGVSQGETCSFGTDRDGFLGPLKQPDFREKKGLKSK